jgi:uncharacterized protein YecE (DUF72 family)
MDTSTQAPGLHIGCSGWNYKHWRGSFYPADLPQRAWLDWYARHFQTVEINNSFYRLPEETTFEHWRAQSPRGFVFAVKASRYLTHMKKLREPDEPLDRLLSHARGLGRKLGPILYQLPAQFLVDAARLETFLDALPRRRRHVIEFRDVSWYVPQVFELLERHGVALCLHDKEGSAIDGPFVGPFVYVRFHGTSGRYHGSYSDAALLDWAQTLAVRWRSGQPVYAYFNNDPNADATRNAGTLKRMLTAVTRETRQGASSHSGVQTARARSRGGASVRDDDVRT